MNAIVNTVRNVATTAMRVPYQIGQQASKMADGMHCPPSLL